MNRDLLSVMLEPDGYVVDAVASGPEALESVSRQRPDLVLLDVMMPGMDGYQVATTIKADVASAGIPIILLTALDDRNSKAHGLRAGAVAVLTKPVNRAELLEHVRSTLRSK